MAYVIAVLFSFLWSNSAVIAFCAVDLKFCVARFRELCPLSNRDTNEVNLIYQRHSNAT